MLYYTTWLISKLDPLRYIFEKPYLSSRITRWQVLLVEYDIVYMTRKAMKGSGIADHFVFGKLTYVLKEEDTKIIRGIPQIYNENKNIKQQMATG